MKIDTVPAQDKTTSILIPPRQVERLRANVQTHAWAAAERDRIVALAEPWRNMTDTELRGLMFGNTIKRAWSVYLGGACPVCKGNVPFMSPIDALRHPWKVRCPHCRELFPKNDFHAFYRSGLDAEGIFNPARADRALLFNSDHADPDDPLHQFGVDDGEGYVEGEHRWRFIGHYLIRGQWRQWVLDGLLHLAEAYVLTGDPDYARKADVLFDRVAELHPTFDFGRQGIVLDNKPGDSGYVSTWHHACLEVREMAVIFDYLSDGLSAATRQKVAERVLKDAMANPHKIRSNAPEAEITRILILMVLDWPANRDEVMGLIDSMVRESTAVDGLTGEKGLIGYAAIAPRSLAQLFSLLSLMEGDVVGQLLRRHPRLHSLFRFHVDAWCLGKYFPLIGDYGYFGQRVEQYPAISWDGSVGEPPSTPSALMPSAFSFCWRLHSQFNDAVFVQALVHANGGSVKGLPHDLFTDDPVAFQRSVQAVIEREGAELKTTSVNKEEWRIAVLRSGSGRDARAAWVSYDSFGSHGHASGMTIGLCAKGLDLLPDNGYPPLMFGHSGPQFNWYWSTAAHNTVTVDGRSQARFDGKTTLWARGPWAQAIRVEPDMKGIPLTGLDHEQVGLSLTTPGSILRVRVLTRADDGVWTPRFEDVFQRTELGPDWIVLDGAWRIEHGRLTGSGTLLCTRRFPGAQRLEFEAVSHDPTPCDLSGLLATDGRGAGHGIYFGFGCDYNQRSLIMYDRRPARNRAAAETDRARIVPGTVHRIACEHDGVWMRHWVDGALIQSCVNDGMPHLSIDPHESSEIKRYARTVVLVDISERDCYLIDLFEVVGGRDHAKFVHSNFATIATTGVNLKPAPDYGHGAQMRNFRCATDVAPGWCADWTIEAAKADEASDRTVHLRYTDLTEGVQAGICDGWVARRGEEEAWIPRVMIRRRSRGGTLASTFIAVLEPYQKHPQIDGIQRSSPTSVDVTLCDGRRDRFEWKPNGRILLARCGPKGKEEHWSP